MELSSFTPTSVILTSNNRLLKSDNKYLSVFATIEVVGTWPNAMTFEEKLYQKTQYYTYPLSRERGVGSYTLGGL